MRKNVALMLSCAMIASIGLVGCGSKEAKKTETTTAAQYHVHTDENGETYTHQNGEEKQTQKSKDKNVIEGSEAIEKIQTFSEKKLGLKEKKKKYSFLASTESKEIEGKKYIEVIASVIKKDKDGKTASIDTKGTYYVSEDGKICLKRNDKTGEMEELK